MSDFEQQERRIQTILGQTDIPTVTYQKLQQYFSFLKEHLDLPVEVTGIEDFHWEEYYVFGPGSAKEYKQLRKTRPSYQDSYQLLRFQEDYDDGYGLIVRLQRKGDRKHFDLPLADLKTTDESVAQSQMIDDYVTWFVNWR